MKHISKYSGLTFVFWEKGEVKGYQLRHCFQALEKNIFKDI